MAKAKSTPTRRKAIAVDPKANAESCFTIMPFGGWFDTYYETIYVRAIEAAGLVARRADDLYRPSTIIHDIWAYTQSAKIVLADLSGKNANVFYELGLAHALAKPAILVTESMDDVPFDLRALRVLEYNKNESRWGEVLQKKITAAIKEVIAAPLQSVLPAFLTVKPESKTKEVSEHEKQFLELKREIDLLRHEVSRNRMRGIQVFERPTSTLVELATAEASTEPSIRESQVLELIKQGLSNSDIAEALNLSIKTVQVYIARLLQKLGLESRSQLLHM